MFGFTLSWDEIARASQAIGDQNTLPVELQGFTTSVTTPVMYALGTMTTALSLAVMLVGLLTVRWLTWRRARRPRVSWGNCIFRTISGDSIQQNLDH